VAITAGYETPTEDSTWLLGDPQGHDGAEVVVRKPLRCRLGWHRWVTRYSSDGTSRFLQCRRCPKEAELELRQWWTGD
jgi:hypothetical protein